MPILQQYYTSYKNEKTGDIGFRIKAMSSGFTPELQTTIDTLIDYQIPPSLPSRDIAAHPVALRYAYQGPERGFLLCSQSCGPDSNGRPGNFFAHTLVIQPGEFTMFPPISFWKSPFWQREDPVERPQLICLPALSRYELEVEGSPDIDFNGIWDFLAQGDRRLQLYKLLCAVIHSHKTGRRAIIHDTTENVSWWIAAVNTLLPPAYRPLLSFATYEHRLRDGRYLITGTTRDWLSGISGISQSFFVLDAETSFTSNVEDSLYARLAAQAAQPDQYDLELLSLFSDFAVMFPPHTDIDEQLDLLALYAQLHKPRADATLSSQELDAIELVLTSFEQAQDRNIEELERLQAVVTRSSSHKDARVAKALGRIKLLVGKEKIREARVEEEDPRKRQVPAEEYQKKSIEEEPGNLQYQKADVEAKPKNDEQNLEDELQQFLADVLQENSNYLQSRLLLLQQRYDSRTLDTSINRPEYLQKLVDQLQQAPLRQVRRMWISLGPHLEPGEHTKSLLAFSLQTMNQLWNSGDGDAEEAKQLVAAMWQAINVKRKEQAWLMLAVSIRAGFPYEECMLRFYYALVSSLDLDQRVLYRKIVFRYYPAILEDELVEDVARKKSAEQGLAEIERWMGHARNNHYSIPRLLQRGLEYLQKSYPSQWQNLIPTILNTPSLTPLPKSMEDQMLEQIQSAFSLSQFSLAYGRMYRRYQNHSLLPDDVKATLSDVLQLVDGELDKKHVKRLHEQVKMLLPDEYRSVVNQCLSGFFEKPGPNNKGQSVLITALFTRNHDYATVFWQLYWEIMREKLTSVPRQFADMLDYWFNSASELNAVPEEFHKFYIVHEFFLLLPMKLEAIQHDRRRYQDGVRQFTQIANQSRNWWYPLVQYHFTERKTLLQSAKSAVLQYVQRFTQSDGPDTNGDEQSRAFEAKVAGLFARDKTTDQISKLFKDLFFEAREQLWSIYWLRFKEVILSGDFELCLKVLSFWFEESFKKLAGVRYAPGEFFMGLPGAFGEARQENESGFNTMMQLIEENAAPYWREMYRWYPLIKENFMVAKSRDRYI